MCCIVWLFYLLARADISFTLINLNCISPQCFCYIVPVTMMCFINVSNHCNYWRCVDSECNDWQWINQTSHTAVNFRKQTDYFKRTNIIPFDRTLNGLCGWSKVAKRVELYGKTVSVGGGHYGPYLSLTLCLNRKLTFIR